jgi:hypothetical protein
MRVIADLYGAGDPHNRHAKREFREIKDAVLADVSDIHHLNVARRLVSSL